MGAFTTEEVERVIQSEKEFKTSVSNVLKIQRRNSIINKTGAYNTVTVESEK